MILPQFSKAEDLLRRPHTGASALVNPMLRRRYSRVPTAQPFLHPKLRLCETRASASVGLVLRGRRRPLLREFLLCAR
jgi:hypothetical protein